MFRCFIVTFLFLFLYQSMAIGAPFFPYETSEKKLSNGLTVISCKMPTPGQAAVMVIVRTGSRDEYEEGHTGFAHLFEHMMFRGTKKRPGNAYYAATQAVGADTNAFTSFDQTAYHLVFASEDLDFILSLEGDRFQNLHYTKNDFKTETGAVLGEYLGGRSHAYSWLKEKVQATAFKQHSYGHTVIGYEEDIKAMPKLYDYSRKFYSRYYRPDNTILLIVGDINHAEALRSVKKHFGSWQKGYTAPKVRPEPKQEKTRRAHVDFPGRAVPTVTLCFKAPAFSAVKKDIVACEVLGPLLFGKQSELFQKLVIDEQKVTRFWPGFSLLRDPGLLTITAALKNKDESPYVEKCMLEAIDDFVKNGTNNKEVKDIIRNRKYGFLSELVNVKWACFAIGHYLALGGSMTTIEDFYKTLSSLNNHDVQNAAKKHLGLSQLSVVTLEGKSKQLSTVNKLNPIVELHEPKDPTVSLIHWFKVGSQNDPLGKEGLCHLTTRMLEKGGTKELSYKSLQKKLFPLCPHIDSRTDKEMTTLSAHIHRDNMNEFYQLWRQIVFAPGFRQEDFDRVKTETLQYLTKRLRHGNDEELAKKTLHHYIYGKTPYSHPLAGYINSVRSITLADVKAFHSRHFTQNNLVNAIGGSYSKTSLLRLRKDCKKLPVAQSQKVAAPRPKMPKGLEIIIVEKESPSTSISGAYPISITRKDKDFMALFLANSWLGEHRNSFSHLYQEIRAKRGLNYGDYTYVEAFPDGGRHEFPPLNIGRRQQLFELWIRSVKSENAIFALRAALCEIDRLARTGLTEEQFLKTQKFLSKYCNHYAKTTLQRLAYKLDDKFYGLSHSHLDTFAKRIRALTRSEVNAAIKRHLQSKNMKIVLVTGDGEKLARQLQSKKKTPITYLTEKTEEILRKDKLFAEFPLPISSIKRIKSGDLFLGQSK